MEPELRTYSWCRILWVYTKFGRQGADGRAPPCTYVHACAHTGPEFEQICSDIYWHSRVPASAELCLSIARQMQCLRQTTHPALAFCHLRSLHSVLSRIHLEKP